MKITIDKIIDNLSNEEKSELHNYLWNSLSISFRCNFIKKHLNLLAYSDLEEEMHKREY